MQDAMYVVIFIFMKWMHSKNKMQRNGGTSRVHGFLCITWILMYHKNHL